MAPPPLLILAALIGPCLGSYATTAALRRAHGEQSTWGRSRCDHCAAPLGLLRTVPVFSFIQQGGACATCGLRIDATHLAGEIAGGVILISAVSVAPLARAGLLSAMGLLLLASAVYDSKTRKLPDDITLAIAVLALAAAALRPAPILLIGLVSAAITFALLEGVRRLFLKWRRKPGLGFGDVKLLSAIALWTGILTPWVVVTAAVFGIASLLIRPSADGKRAFGPCIAASAWLIGIGGEARLWPT